jgi:hypothetical protein
MKTPTVMNREQEERGHGVTDRLPAEDGIVVDRGRYRGERADKEHRDARAGHSTQRTMVGADVRGDDGRGGDAEAGGTFHGMER